MLLRGSVTINYHYSGIISLISKLGDSGHVGQIQVSVN
jgi:hypothetical protein